MVELLFGVDTVVSAWLVPMLFTSEVGAFELLFGADPVVPTWLAVILLTSVVGAVELLLGEDVVEAFWIEGTVVKVLCLAEDDIGEIAEVTGIVATVSIDVDLLSMVRFRKSLPVLAITILKGKKSKAIGSEQHNL